jgi:hypothetical protein
MKQICPECDEFVEIGTVVCPECDWRFAFRSTKLTSDLEWVTLIDELSDQGRLFFTTNQFFIHWQRPRVLRLDSSTARMYLAILILLASSILPISINLVSVFTLSLIAYIPIISRLLAIFLSIRWLRRLINLSMIILVSSAYMWFKINFAATLPLLLFLAALVEYQWYRRTLSKQSFMKQLQRWQRYHKIPELLVEPSMYRPHTELQGDGLYDYNVRRILIVDQDLTVDLLTKNGFLKDEHLILVSLNGYPEYNAQFARRLLTIEEDVNVYILHRDGREVKETMTNLRALGVRKHRILHLGWGSRNRNSLVDHLGFKPRDWDAFAIDSIPPESLLEGLPVALEDEIPLVDVLGPRLRLLA